MGLTRDRLRRAGALLLFMAVYIAAGKLGLAHAVLNPSATAVWLPTGIALSMAMLAGRESWPWIAAGAFIVNITTAGTVWSSLAIAGGNAVEAVAGAWLLRRFARGTEVFYHPASLLRFVPLICCSCAISATVGTATLFLGHMVHQTPLFPIWTTWWLGDVLGAILACPPLVLWLSARRTPLRPGHWLEAACVGLAVVAAGLVIFGTISPGRQIIFLCLPLILWAGLRLGPRETATASLLLMGIAWYGPRDAAVRDQDRDILLSTSNAAILTLQGFMAVVTLTGLAVASAMSERALFEATLESRARELKRSNADLEQFASIASHDLKEPLRMVRCYLELIERRSGGALDGESGTFLRYAVDASGRMGELIDAIMAYSQVSHGLRRTVPVEIRALLEDTTRLLGQRITETGAIITIGELPTVQADPARLGLVFQNLLSNALKFCRGRAPQVRISAEAAEREWVFSVRDNGIGIEPAAQQKVFEMFQRQHSQQEFPGSGIGLATCRRVIEDHGGRIWLSSEPEIGTTVCFALPMDPQAAAPSSL